ncbi:glycosyltransferase [Cryobacterium sp. PH31-AA6]|uniref:glycosyltransferase n=1 Tax=Cryobacterium sp. PH31-AA6 TaxID=3046205 RepID=UPI0024B9FB06|nr:glycosyltransferase [Cryobacterium sp. PH31-AA6]MDJ0325394.1 glycosyltransferase [Cryobacterium sp. PH31-AA6]
MRIMLLTAGSRGDVEPFAALARFAASRGHTVRLGVPDNSGADVAGLDVVSLQIDFAQLVSARGVSPLAAARSFTELIRPAMRRLMVAATRESLAFGPDVILYHPKVLSAPLVAQALGIPHITVESVPTLTRTRAFAAPGVVNINVGPLNRLTYAAAAGAAGMFRKELAAARELLPAPGGGRPAPRAASLIPVSPQLLARPDDWPASVHLTGIWREDTEPGAPEPALLDFIDSGAFLYAGLGSMAAGDPIARGRAVIEAARAHGLRTLMATGWGGLAVPDDLRGSDVLVIPSVSHDVVLPRAEIALHHGGAGTVHAVARAGIPQIVVPFIADQPFWGRQLHGRGLAPRPVPYKKVSATSLSPAIGEALGMRRRAAEVGVLIRTENGLGLALDVIEAEVSR